MVERRMLPRYFVHQLRRSVGMVVSKTEPISHHVGVRQRCVGPQDQWAQRAKLVDEIVEARSRTPRCGTKVK